MFKRKSSLIKYDIADINYATFKAKGSELFYSFVRVDDESANKYEFIKQYSGPLKDGFKLDLFTGEYIPESEKRYKQGRGRYTKLSKQEFIEFLKKKFSERNNLAISINGSKIK